MTEEQLDTIPMVSVSHSSMVGEYCSTYYNEVYRIGMCVHTPRNDDGSINERRKSYTHYKLGDRVFKSKEKFLEAIKNIPFIVKHE